MSNQTILPQEFQYDITHFCGLNEVTNYCSLGNDVQTEATARQKIEAIYMLAKLGFKTGKILGGEPFDLEEIKEVIHALNKTGMAYAIATNGVNTKKILDIASSIGFEKDSGLFFSVDFYDNKASAIGGCSEIKTEAALELIPRLVGQVPILGVNTVVHNKNLLELPKILQWITDLGGWLNICTLMWGDWSQFIYRAKDKSLALLPEHHSQVEDTMGRLLEMKKQGFHLACSEEYIAGLADVCCRQDRFGWDCNQLASCPLLRVGPDLSLMVCSDLKGAIVSRFKLADLLDPIKRDQFLQAWLEDPHRCYCCDNFGCYWSNVFRAGYNFPLGSLKE